MPGQVRQAVFDKWYVGAVRERPASIDRILLLFEQRLLTHLVRSK